MQSSESGGDVRRLPQKPTVGEAVEVSGDEEEEGRVKSTGNSLNQGILMDANWILSKPCSKTVCF